MGRLVRLLLGIALLAAVPVSAAVHESGAAAATAPVVSASLLGPMVNVRPGDATSGAPGRTLRAQPGTFTSFQVVVRNDGATELSLDGVSVDPLVGPGGAVIGGQGTNQVTVFREAYTRIWTPSDQETWCPYFDASSHPYCGIPIDGDENGDPVNVSWKCGKPGTSPLLPVTACQLPDALIPDIDSMYGEERKAFPVAIPPGENRMVWVDVFVPASATPGTYAGPGAVRVTAGGVDTTLDLTLEVAGLALPALGSDPTTELGGGTRATWGQICRAYDNGCTGNVVARARLMSLYDRVALENRFPITEPAGGIDPTAANRGTLDTWIRPMLTGGEVVDPQGALLPRRSPAARNPVALLDLFTSADQAHAWQRWTETFDYAEAVRFYCDELYTPTAWRDGCANPYLAVTGAGGWDNSREPLHSALIGSQAVADQQAGFQADPAVLHRALTRIPVTSHLQPRGEGSQRGVYDAPGGFLAGRPDRSLWLYSSNASLGAGEAWSPHEFWNGWPVLGGVDQPPVSEAAGPVAAWMYRTTGYFYYDSVIALPSAWEDCSTGSACLYQFGGHGDGTLFYPFSQAIVGGTRPIPIESMRLKRNRDGAQVYSLLRQLETGCGGACAPVPRAALEGIVGDDDPGSTRGLFGSMYDTAKSAGAWDDAVGRLLDLLPEGDGPATRVGDLRARWPSREWVGTDVVNATGENQTLTWSVKRSALASSRTKLLTVDACNGGTADDNFDLVLVKASVPPSVSVATSAGVVVTADFLTGTAASGVLSPGECRDYLVTFKLRKRAPQHLAKTFTFYEEWGAELTQRDVLKVVVKVR